MTTNFYYVATVEYCVGNRNMCSMIKNAGLGLTGAYKKERIVIRYDIGQEVDEARVMKAMGSMIKELDARNEELIISNPVVIRITRLDK
jgi:hypothetical protein